MGGENIIVLTRLGDGIVNGAGVVILDTSNLQVASGITTDNGTVPFELDHGSYTAVGTFTDPAGLWRDSKAFQTDPLLTVNVELNLILT